MKSKTTLGLIALALIAFLANWLMSLTPIGSRGLDLTEDRVHTISDGTKSILKELEAPVTVHYYATRKSTFLPKELKLYMKKVDDFLKQYESLAKGKLRIEYLDPQPDTDAEDSANLDGISGQRINDENIYFGLSVQCLDKKATIPFLNPNDATMLEYDLSRAIAQVSQAKKPVIGLMSALPITGSNAPQIPGQPQRGPQPWVVYEQLQEVFEIRELGMSPATINAEELSVLFLLHPAGITKETEYQIDQFVLNGGTVVAALDAFSIVAEQSKPAQQNPMMPQQGGVPSSSNLPTLLPAWGVEFISNQVVADSRYRTKMGNNQVGVALLSLTKEALPLEDDTITQGINDLFFVLSGGFINKGVEGIDSSVMAQTSTETALVDGQKASRLDQSLLREMKGGGTVYPLVMRLNGEFKTAFPDGNPADAVSKEKPEENATKEEKKSTSLTEAKEAGTIFLIADTDMFFDQFAYQIQNLLGMRMAQPRGGNAGLLENILDQATGSKYLIGARSRAETRRPFTVVQEMEAAFEQKAGEKIAQLEEEQNAVRQKLAELQQQKAQGNELLLSPEQEAEIRNLRTQQVEFSRQIRELQKDLRKEKDQLAAKVTIANVVIVPLGVLLAGFFVFLKRRSATRAK